VAMNWTCTGGGGGVDTDSNIGSFGAFLRFPMGKKFICLLITSDFLLPNIYLVVVHYKFFISKATQAVQLLLHLVALA